MSLSVSIFPNKNEIIVASDSRKNIEIDGIQYILDDNCDKLRLVHNKLIFMCGMYNICDSILQEYKEQDDGSIEKFKGIAESVVNKYLLENKLIENKNLFLCNFQLFYYDNVKDTPVVVNVHSEDDFIIHSHNHYLYWGIGASCDVAESYISTHLNTMSLDELLLNTFKKVSAENIGGKMSVYRINNKGISFLYKVTIPDSRVMTRIESLTNIVSTNQTSINNVISLQWAAINSDPATGTAQSTANSASSAASSAQSTANGAMTVAQQIAAGTYAGGTFIDGKNIYSPTIRTGTSGKMLILTGSQLQSVNNTTQDGFTLDGSTGDLQWFSAGFNRGGIYKNFSGVNEQLVLSHNNWLGLVGSNRIDLQGTNIVFSSFTGAPSTTTFANSVAFNTTVTGLTTAAMSGLEGRLTNIESRLSNLESNQSSILSRLNYLENTSFNLAYRSGNFVYFNSLNVSGVDNVDVSG